MNRPEVHPDLGPVRKAPQVGPLDGWITMAGGWDTTGRTAGAPSGPRGITDGRFPQDHKEQVTGEEPFTQLIMSPLVLSLKMGRRQPASPRRIFSHLCLGRGSIFGHFHPFMS